MSQVRRSVMRRLQEYGLRVICSRCATEQRHFPQSGRLREARCKLGRCGGRLRSIYWTKRNPERWAQLVHETRERLRPFGC